MGAVSTGKQVFSQIQHDNCSLLAGAMAYNLLLALPPTLVFMLAMFGLIGEQQNVVNQVTSYARQFLPASGMEFFMPLIQRMVTDSSGGLALVAILAALWAASSGAGVVIQGLQLAYSQSFKTMSFLKSKLLALLVVVSLGLALFLGSNLLIFGTALTEFLIHTFNLGQSAELWLDVTRWTLAIGLILGFSTWVYSIVPTQSGEPVTMKQALPGAIVFVAIWLLVSVLFSFYVENFSNYNKVYGTLGALIVVMIWLYISSLALLIGGEVNGVLHSHHNDPLSSLNPANRTDRTNTGHARA